MRLRGWACALLVAAACGKSDDQKLLEARQAICEALVARSPRVSDAAASFAGGQLAFDAARDCTTGLLVLQGDRCGTPTGVAGDHHQDVLCRRAWQWLARDATLCNVVLGCYYWCEVYSLPQEPAAPVDDSTICAARFASGQAALKP